ncbi:hypothetical protein K3495_g12686 [Podosphaera aphanis]|nr:hypothetical protein K3495_g12686 [Podosphaera aphanis]
MPNRDPITGRFIGKDKMSSHLEHPFLDEPGPSSFNMSIRSNYASLPNTPVGMHTRKRSHQSVKSDLDIPLDTDIPLTKAHRLNKLEGEMETLKDMMSAMMSQQTLLINELRHISDLKEKNSNLPKAETGHLNCREPPGPITRRPIQHSRTFKDDLYLSDGNSPTWDAWHGMTVSQFRNYLDDFPDEESKMGRIFENIRGKAQKLITPSTFLDR